MEPSFKNIIYYLKSQPVKINTPLRKNLELTKVADKLFENSVKVELFREDYKEFKNRIKNIATKDLKTRDISRISLEMWDDVEIEWRINSLLEEVVNRNRKQLDLNIIFSYLIKYPEDHKSFKLLSAIARLAALRDEKSWKIKQEKYDLFSEDRPTDKLALKLLENSQSENILRDAGIVGPLLAGKFFEKVFQNICFKAAFSKKDEAENIGRKIIALKNTYTDVSLRDTYLALGLMGAFIGGDEPSKQYQDDVINVLVHKIGDPRVNSSRWNVIANEINEMNINGYSIIALLKKWLVKSTVNEFFALVRQTTERPDQWNEREQFWKQYLDAGLIDDACFILGSRAVQQYRYLNPNKQLPFSEHHGGGASVASKSSILMNIKGVIIAEWSDNSTCKFWRKGSKLRPRLHQKRYYIDTIKPNYIPDGDTIAHLSSWQKKFREKIYEYSGVNINISHTNYYY